MKTLSRKQAISVPQLKTSITGSKTSKKASSAELYAITRSIKNLSDSGLIETIQSDQNDYARLTKKGRQKLASINLDSKTMLLNPAWDGKWRIILLDLPESRKAERESLRYLLKKAGFICLKNSAWISPYPFEHLFTNIKKDFGLTTEIMIIVTSSIDAETEKEIQKLY